jgi:hypothetical protein
MNRMGMAPKATVYHGSPHQFDEFDASKIGTGEGAQAYGHGIYLADKPEVAQDYQFMLSKIDPENVSYAGKSAQKHYEKAYAMQDRGHRTGDKNLIDQANAQAAFWEGIMTRRHPQDMIRMANSHDDGWPTLKAYANSLDMKKFQGVDDAGHLYKADLPDEKIARMLDWDKPLSEQAHIQDVAKQLGLPAEIPRDTTWGGDALRPAQGMEFYSAGRTKLGEAGFSDALRQAGIPGIRYLDQGSRGAGDGTRNYVVFPGEEKNVKILERNGQLIKALEGSGGR